MKAKLPKLTSEDVNGLKTIQTPSEAREAAKEVADAAFEKHKQEKGRIKDLFDQIQSVDPSLGGMEEIAALLAMPDEQFVFLAPIFLEELEKRYKDINNQMEIVQLMNVRGFKSEDIRNEYILVCEEVDKQYTDYLSNKKRDFLKRVLGLTYNVLAEAENIGKKTLLIPIEYCHPNAKTPAYAHLTDSGMDVFALEDITIMPGETKLIPIGIKVAIPQGYELQVRPKSGKSLRTKLRVANTPGTIDAGYRDEICVIIDNIDYFIRYADITAENGTLLNPKFGSSYTIGKGEKFAQLVLSEVPKACFYTVQSVDDIENDGRAGGFGSTGLK
jgi:dUTP pyrophosphatase